VKAPKLFIRDTGIMHATLRLPISGLQTEPKPISCWSTGIGASRKNVSVVNAEELKRKLSEMEYEYAEE